MYMSNPTNRPNPLPPTRPENIFRGQYVSSGSAPGSPNQPKPR